MNGAWWLSVAVAVGSIVHAVVKIAADKEYDYWAPRLSAYMIRAAALLLPPATRGRYRQEWLAELHEASAQGGALTFGLGEVAWAAPAVAARMVWQQATIWATTLGSGLAFGLTFGLAAALTATLTGDFAWSFGAVVATVAGVGLVAGLAIAMVDVLGTIPMFVLATSIYYGIAGRTTAQRDGLVAGLVPATGWGIGVTLAAVLIIALINRLGVKRGVAVSIALALGLGLLYDAIINGAPFAVDPGYAGALMGAGVGMGLGSALGGALSTASQLKRRVALLALTAGLVFGPFIWLIETPNLMTLPALLRDFIGGLIALLGALEVGVGAGLVYGPVYKARAALGVKQRRKLTSEAKT